MALVRQLGDADIKVRAQAVTELVSRGTVAIPVLRHAVNDLDDAAIAACAERCLQIIDGPSSAALPAAVARLVALRKPPGAAKVLLAYLPFSDDQTVIDEVGNALAAVAFRDGKPDPVLLKALGDPVPLRRAMAGAALCRKEQPGPRAAVTKLLRDPRPMVRLRIALALADQQDIEAVPVLIDLLAELPPAHRAPIEAFLQQLAGEWSPTLSFQGDDDVSRKTRRDAWAGWWRNTEGAALLAEFRKRTLTQAEQDRLLALIQNLGERHLRHPRAGQRRPRGIRSSGRTLASRGHARHRPGARAPGRGVLAATSQAGGQGPSHCRRQAGGAAEASRGSRDTARLPAIRRQRNDGGRSPDGRDRAGHEGRQTGGRADAGADGQAAAASGGSRRGAGPIRGAGAASRGQQAPARHLAHPGSKVCELHHADASKARIRTEASGKRYLHLATHGFFAPRRAPGDVGSTRKQWDAAVGWSAGRSGDYGYPPGLLSGLALAGANPDPNRVTGQTTEDGILTALEVSATDLRGVELVVLSACETGLGREAGGEGLLGLQRAFQVSGAETVLASLWKVEDRATQRLMERFYENLWQKKMGPAEALRQAQISLLRDSRAGSTTRGFEVVPADPSAGALTDRDVWLWAAWVLSGDPGDVSHITPLLEEDKGETMSSVPLPSVPPPYTLPWMLWIGGGVVAGIILTTLIFWLRRRRQSVTGE